MKIKLTEWAARWYSPAPSRMTLRRLAGRGEIYPPPELVGREFYVDEDAQCQTLPANITPAPRPPPVSPAPSAKPTYPSDAPWLLTGEPQEVWWERCWRRAVVFSPEQALAGRVAPSEVPPHRGIYLLYRGDRMVYIGETLILSERLMQHARARPFESVFAFPTPAAYRKRIEASWIRATVPDLNVRFEPFWMPELTAAIRDLWRHTL